jgi:hypothetical protein
VVNGGLQIGVAIHLEEVVGWERQAIQVFDHRAVGVVVHLTVWGLI